jgi:predicted signal transduction protein with EAL and GGDEF domain
MSKQLRATNKKTGLSIRHQAVVDAVRGRGINGRAIIGYRHELKNPMIELKITH